jgi:hypothetical protein
VAAPPLPEPPLPVVPALAPVPPVALAPPVPPPLLLAHPAAQVTRKTETQNRKRGRGGLIDLIVPKLATVGQPLSER